MNASRLVATLLAALLGAALVGCGSDSSDNTSDQPSITVDADFARQSGAAVQNVLAEVARVAKGALLLQGRVRDGAFPSASGSASPQTAKPAPRAATGEPCPAIATEFTEDGWIMTLDYGPSPGCQDAFDDVERSGTLTITMTDLVYDPRYFFPIAGRATLSFADFRIGNTALSGSGRVNIVSWTLESWDLDLAATGPAGRQDFTFQGIVTAEAERDDETINGTGVATISGRSLQITASGLAYDFDWTRTSLICDEPVGGSLTLTGTNTATLDFGYPSPGCGFADLTMNHGAPDRVSIDETPRADDVVDLVIGVDEAPTPVVVGEHLTYTVTVFNAGADASGVVLSNLLPSSVRWVSTVSSQGTCAGALTVTCELGDLPRLGRTVVTIVGVPTATGWFENMASVTATGDDAHYADNVFFRWTLVTGATDTGPSGVDLVLNVAAAPESILAGDQVTYTLTVSNEGQETATGVVVLETIPYNAQWVSSATTQGSCTGNAPVTCSLGSLDAGAQATVTVVISTDPSYGYYYGGTLYNSASVSGTVQDDMPLNNTVNLNLPVFTPVPNPSRIEVTPASSFTLGTGSTKQLYATAYSDDPQYPPYYYNPSVVWTSSDDAVLTVSTGGLATARAVGSATVTASIGSVTSNAVTIRVEEVQTIVLPANDLVYDPHTQRLLASVPSHAGDRGNTVTAINPATGAIDWSIFVGSEPGKLALSADGRWLYVALNGATGIQRVDVTNRVLDIWFSLGGDATSGAYRARDMEVLPGQPGSIAVSRASTYYSAIDIAIYDDGVQRPTTTTSYQTGNAITFSDAATTLYAFGGYTLQTLAVSSAGVSVSSTANNVVSSYDSDIEFEGGRLYFATGQVVDPVTTTLLGTFALTDPSFSYYSPVTFAPDAASGKTYFLHVSGTSRFIRAFDDATFRPNGVIEVQDSAFSSYAYGNEVGSLRRFGSNGLAFRADGQRIVLVRNSLLP